ncbi:MAG TPA: XTP/dITP diphosphatase [Polyangiales bacterium]|jgi:XTP/dITP diphosphohydrolase|nr:XTP/dITP diphosphatase [Polyangiales bacterium]
MTTNLVLATKNPGKVREFRALFWDVPRLRVRALDELGKMPDVIEDGKTFDENAIKKAREIAAVTGTLVLADDSGLEVDALTGRPGVHSARFAGRHGDDAANNDKLLAEMSRVADGERTARYRVVLALADPKGPLGEEVHTEEGTCQGIILRARRGSEGFGYDPLFRPDGYELSFAELAPDDKNRISHRAVAAAKMRAFLAEYLERRSQV